MNYYLSVKPKCRNTFVAFSFLLLDWKFREATTTCGVGYYNPYLNPTQEIVPSTGRVCSVSSNLASAGARQVRPLKTSKSPIARDVVHLPPPAASATLLWSCHMHSTRAWGQHFWQGGCGNKSSQTPSGVSYSSTQDAQWDRETSSRLRRPLSASASPPSPLLFATQEHRMHY